MARKLGASTVQYDSDQQKFLSKLKSQEGLLDSSVVFAPSDSVTDAAIKAVKKGGTIVIGVFGNVPNFMAADEKTIRGTLIGSMVDAREAVRIEKENGLKVISKSFPLD